METLRLIMVTIPKDEAAAMARGLVENKLAACVNIVGDVKSYFFWEDSVQDEKEKLLLIKSTASKFKEIEQFVKEHHPYELPEIIGFDIAASSEEYAAWMVNETKSD